MRLRKNKINKNLCPVMQVIEVLITALTTQVIPSMITETLFIAVPNPLPEIVTIVPPAVGPRAGLMLWTTGVASFLYSTVEFNQTWFPFN